MADKQTTTSTSKKGSKNVNNIIMGLGTFLVCASAVYAIALIVIGTKDLMQIVWLTPLIVWTAWQLIKRFITSN